MEMGPHSPNTPGPEAYNPLMSTKTLDAIHREREAAFMSYGVGGGDESSGAGGDQGTETIELVESFGAYEAEYAAVRKAVGVMDQPHRGLIRVTGADGAEFLQRMLSNDVVNLTAGRGRGAYRLNNKGRIIADLTVLRHEGWIDLELDATDAGAVAGELDRYLFSEDVQVADITGDYAHVTLMGPGALDVLRHHAADAPSEPLEDLSHAGMTIGGHACVVFRRDETGTPNLHVLIPVEGAVKVYELLMGPLTHDTGGDRPKGITPRPIGWLAYNTARIEAGTPLYHVDFGPDSLPHETGPLLQRNVSFTKGCYAGQEVVARMQNLGHPKRVLVGLKIDSDKLPIAPTEVYEHDPDRPGEANLDQPIGAVTSSTLSPMLSGKAIGLATLKWGRHTPGTMVAVPAEGGIHPATVHGTSFL